MPIQAAACVGITASLVQKGDPVVLFFSDICRTRRMNFSQWQIPAYRNLCIQPCFRIRFHGQLLQAAAAPWKAASVMMGLAFVLSLCSSSDAVVGQKYGWESPPVGLTWDFWCAWPYDGHQKCCHVAWVLNPSFVIRLFATTFLVCFLVDRCIYIGEAEESEYDAMGKGINLSGIDRMYLLSVVWIPVVSAYLFRRYLNYVTLQDEAVSLRHVCLMFYGRCLQKVILTDTPVSGKDGPFFVFIIPISVVCLPSGRS